MSTADGSAPGISILGRTRNSGRLKKSYLVCFCVGLLCEMVSACFSRKSSENAFGSPKISAWVGQFWTQLGNSP